MTDQAVLAVLRGVRIGLYPERAAQMAGVNPSTMRSFRKDNEEFRTLMEKAEAEGEASLVGRIIRHMDSQWTAAAWMLERRFPERWAKSRVDVDSESTMSDTEVWRSMNESIPGRAIPPIPEEEA